MNPVCEFCGRSRFVGHADPCKGLDDLEDNAAIDEVCEDILIGYLEDDDPEFEEDEL